MTTKKKNKISEDAIQAHLALLQSIIQRMATNSSSSKAWCIAIVSAMLVIVGEKNKTNYLFLTYIPTLLFFSLDSYYLALERSFRNSYNEFIDKLHERKIKPADLYVIAPKGNFFNELCKSVISFSIWPFYSTLLGMALFAKYLL
ncbi:hypothetical protein [Leptospira stimsonii]|uniref:Uncharacterized protein n=1 Tax=Leptospira stimsonii TaxID=2202203 RepID=A0ABY2MWG0_9LEPT|nr:hypothetical protein [Leptospira stimsonii]TGK12950.1 hypothetical protein EHO98_19230 [Leptospira stimsonii]TGM10124.1 hypothetical protein EHQ90_19515 [Leptospira stimsonii]